MTAEKLTYEILCVDATGDSVIETEINLLYSLLAHGKIWKNPIIKEKCIYDDTLGIILSANLIETDSDFDDSLKISFLIKIKGKYEQLESLRITFCEYLKSQKFDYIYVLTDDVSKQIANQIYPEINKVENALRKYLMKFFVTKLGPNWWAVTADSEMKKKVDARKRNETIFSQYVDNKAYLIDFGELGKMVFSQSSGFISKEDIIEKVMNLKEDSTSIIQFKSELQSNYNKFFRETFKDKNFQSKWEELEKIRHKIAHNNLFVQEDLKRALELTTDLNQIIKDANDKIDKIAFSIDEKEAIRDNIVLENYAYKVITDIDLLEKLSESESWAKSQADGFVGVVSFVKNFLGSKGFDYRSSIDVIDRLEKKGLIEKYEHRSNKNEYPVRAIRRIYQTTNQVHNN